MTSNKLCPKALGLSLGVMWGLSVLIMGLLAHHFMYGAHVVQAVGTLYIGYGPSLLGSFIGGLIGFANAFISGYLLAWFYNCFSGCPSKKGKE